MAVYPETPSITEVDLRFDRAWKGRIHDSQGYIDCVVDAGATLRRDISTGILCVGALL